MEDTVRLVLSRLVSFVLVLVTIVAIESRGRWCDPQEAVRAAETQGFSKVIVTGHHYWAVGLRGCDTQDAAKFDIVAKNAAGKDVQFYVCTGLWFKGATIRSK